MQSNALDYTSARLYRGRVLLDVVYSDWRRAFSGEMMTRKLAFVVGGVAAGGVAAFLTLAGAAPRAQQSKSPPDSTKAPLIAASDSGRLKGPRQPIFFRHDIHAGQYKMQCQYCHYSVAVSPEPGIPSVQTCMGCHLVIGGRDSSHQAEIKKVRQAWTEKKPIRGSGCTTSRVTLISRTSGTSRRWAPTHAPPATATIERMPQVHAGE